MCLNNTYNNVPIGIYLSDKLSIQNGLKQGDALSPVIFIFAFRICTLEWIKIEWACQSVVYAVDDNILQNIGTLLVAGTELSELSMLSHQKHKGQNNKER
jgi:hypothetical protein